MKLLIIGAQSGVGVELLKLLKERHIEWVAPEPGVINIQDPLSAARVITQAAPDQVINLAAFRAGSQLAVLEAEHQAQRCDDINHLQTELIAQVCDHLHVPLIHLSSVYVFGGEKKLAYNEQDPPRPNCVYGHAALAGEQAIISTIKQHIIIRAGWLFGPQQDEMMRQWVDELRAGDGNVTVFRRKFAPTPVEDLARVILAVSLQVDCQVDVWGVYHYASLEALRESEFVQQLVKFAAQHDESVYRLLDHLNINLGRTEPPQIANATLASKKIFETFGIKQRPWHGSLQRLVKSWYKVRNES
ncbi:NAD-dependent epimerase/dehydratase family protein [Gammaproteobacteria bacterium LSUCC0112]|nr:NAD-dependent epimerase/dehydratase family protein [Gammaproteobacteria bacterium LSUCC0112]